MYEDIAHKELREWEKEMMHQPSLLDRMSKRVQAKMNSYIPEKVHKAVTVAIKQMVKGVLYGSKITTSSPKAIVSLEQTEEQARKVIARYRRAGAIEGGVTGAGGILLGLADFPILLSIKIKLLFDLAALYGFDVMDYKERLYLLHIFQLAFSSAEHRRDVFMQMQDWDQKKNDLPKDLSLFEWRTFQQEYRDYIDLAKLAQLIPGIGAVVGWVANHQLINKLGRTAMNAYRMRLFPP